MSKLSNILKVSIPLYVLISIASAAIIITGVNLFVGGFGMYESSELGYSVLDADPNDEVDITYTESSQVLSFTFPMWVNQTAEYRDVIGFIPDADGYLILSDVDILEGNIIDADFQLTDGDEYTYPHTVRVGMGTSDLNVSVIAGNQYNFSFRIVTGPDELSPESITFDVIKK